MHACVTIFFWESLRRCQSLNDSRGGFPISHEGLIDFCSRMDASYNNIALNVLYTDRQSFSPEDTWTLQQVTERHGSGLMG